MNPKHLIVVPCLLILILTISVAFSLENENVTISSQGMIARALKIKRYIYWDSRWSVQNFVDWTDGMQAHDDVVQGYSILSVRPDYTTFLYRNVRDCHNTHDYVYNNSKMSELDYFRSQGWLLKDVNGNEVTDPTWGNNHFCDIGSAAYQQYIADWYGYWIRLHHYPACFLDRGMYSTAGSWSYGAKGTPVNPRTAQPWTNDEVINAYTGLYSAIRQKIGRTITIVANSGGASTGYKYFSFPNNRLGTTQLSKQIDGLMSENWMGAEGTSYIPEVHNKTNYDWKSSVDMLVDLENQLSGKSIVLVALGADDCPDLTTDSLRQQYCTFEYASMLLGIGTKNTYWLTLGFWGLKNMQSLYSMKVGTPTESYHQNPNGLFVRQFTNAIVTVNPSLTDTRGGLAPHTATISLKAS